MKPCVFRSELLDGHKGAAVIVPFDPRRTWGTAPVPVDSDAYGTRPGHPVRGTLNGHPFEGWIGCRWGRYFLLVGEELQCAAGVFVGDMVEVSIAPAAVPGSAAGALAAPKSPKKRARKR